MLFNSLDFILFFVIFYGIYLKVSFKLRNLYLLTASYFFYGHWDYRFLFLLFASTVVDFYCGKKIYETEDKASKKKFLQLSLVFNLGLLGVFKYFNFFVSSFQDLMLTFGLSVDISVVEILLPVGISFYTFQTMSYAIDIHRGKLKPIDNFFDFALFVSFFPQLVAGPIERAVNLIPQILNPHEITLKRVKEGMYLVLWGYYKKVFIADRCAIISNNYFNNSMEYAQTGDVIVGVLAFTFQIYGDFSGYTDIARGIARLMGFDLMLNFKMPYFSQNPSEFWRRWHISLSSWLRDYLYISLGGNRGGELKRYRNLFLTMLLGGLWHGAAWNFVLWGCYHGLLLIFHRLITDKLKINFPFILNILLMFFFTCVGWLLFRATSVQQISDSFLAFFNWGFSHENLKMIGEIIFLNSFLTFIQYKKYQTDNMNYVLGLKKWKIYLFIVWTFSSILLLGQFSGSEFLYFQF